MQHLIERIGALINTSFEIFKKLRQTKHQSIFMEELAA
jgi:hypothetical protein